MASTDLKKNMPENKILKLGEILLEEGLISHDQLMECLQIQKKDGRLLGEILIAKGLVSDKEISQILARTYQLPYVDLSTTTIDEKVFGIVSHELISKHKVIPIELKGSLLTVATNNPLDVTAFQEIQYMSGLQVKPVIASLPDIIEHLSKYSDSMQAMHAINRGQDTRGESSAPVVKLVESIIMKAIQERASDIHIEPQKDSLRVRYRVDGELYEKTPIDKDIERKVISRIKILAGMDVADNRKPQDGRMSVSDRDLHYDIRVSTLPNIYGENMVMRILDKSFTDFSFSSLGMDEHEIKTIKALSLRPYGMILVTGPTGAGKSTTLYSILSSLNEKSTNIITVEDPVEYKLSGVNQTAINNQAGYTFATAIRHILRHDPDIIMVGEIRDIETAEISIRAALTGHLVLSTLHTNTAPGAIMRLLDMSIEPFLIQSAVIGVIAQRLIRRLCPHCKVEYKPSAEVIESIRPYATLPNDLTLAKAQGCEKCFKTGYTGRVAVYESLLVNEAIRNMILKSPSEQELTRLAISRGMKTLRNAGIEKAIRKVTSLEEVMQTTFVEEKD